MKHRPRRTYRIAVLPGDGIGPEVTESACSVLAAAAQSFDFDLSFSTSAVGGAGLDLMGDPFPQATEEACLLADSVLLGAVGGPDWDEVDLAKRPERGLLRLRAALGLYANLRPVVADRSRIASSRSVDILIVRELTGGIYFGRPSDRRMVDGIEVARDTMVYSAPEIERVAKVAFEWARRRRRSVTSVDKANVLATSRLWREVVTALQLRDYSDVQLGHEYVDIAAMKLVSSPDQFDVILTGNLFGDILSDLAAALPGSIGLLPSASIGDAHALFEPVHGSAPDIAGKGRANPLGAILSGAMMLEHLGEFDAAGAIRSAVDDAMAGGACTDDMAGPNGESVSTAEMTQEILSRLGYQVETTHE